VEHQAIDAERIKKEEALEATKIYQLEQKLAEVTSELNKLKRGKQYPL
jgi:chromosome segregation ATPase